MADIFRDAFTDTNGTALTAHTPDTGTGWTEVWKSGTDIAEVQSNEVMPDGLGASEGFIYSADATYSSADYKVFADVTTQDSSDDVNYIMARMTDQDNFYAIKFNEDVFTLYKKVTGTWTQLDDEAVTLPVDTDVIQLRVQGTSIKGYINGVEHLTSTDSDITASGEAGFGMGGGAELQTTADDLSAQAITEFYVTDFATDYPGVIADLGADHHWDFDGDSLDQIGSVNGTNTSVLFTDGAIAEDATNCVTTNASTDRVSIPTTTDINNSAQDRKVVCGWFETTAIQTPPRQIYSEGDNTTNFQFLLAYGNNAMFEVTEPTNFNIQVYGPVLQPNRVYHLLGLLRGNTQGNTVDFYVDGVKQTLKEPTDGQPDNVSLDSRGVAEFGDAASTSGSGEQIIVLTAPINGRWNHWATWSGATIESLTDTVIRDDLFEKGALPDVTITSGTESAMQTTLDTYADTVRGDAPLCIRVPANTGDTSFTLELDNITFDPLASIHVQYTGTATLTLVNTNGSDCSITSVTNGGTITVATEQTLTVTVRDAAGGDTESVDTYYFDGSDAAALDEGSDWSNVTNFDDGDIDTDASVTKAGSTSTLKIEGTNAPSSGGTITQVRARIYGFTTDDDIRCSIYTDGLAETIGSGSAAFLPSTEGWSNYDTLTTPTGGWSWAKLQALEARLIYNSGNPVASGTSQASRVEIEVTSGASDAIENARVYIEADTGGDLTAGTEIMNAATNSSGVATATFQYTSDQPVVGRVRKGTASTYYKTSALPSTLTATPLNTTVLMVEDE